MTPWLVVIVRGNDSKIDMFDLLAVLQGQVTEVAQGHGCRKGEGILGPENACGFVVEGTAYRHAPNGNLVASLLLLIRHIVLGRLG